MRKLLRAVITRAGKAVALCALLPALAVATPTATAASESDPSALQPGGAATSTGSFDNRNAFSHASGNIDFASQFRFKIGDAIFRKLWVSAPASTKSSDGLGPLFNARSCQRCHLKDGRGHPPGGNWPHDNAVSMFLRLSIPPQTDADHAALASGRLATIPDPIYGRQLQDNAIQGLAAEGRMHISYRRLPFTYPDGEIVELRQPEYRITDLGYGPLHPNVMLSPRIAPQMIGLGLLELIPEKDILALEDPEDADGDGISGRANRVWSLAEERLALGRFGWKAGQPTVVDQTVHAFAGDMGLSTRLMPAGSGECSAQQADCRAQPSGAEPGDVEVPDKLLDLVVFYTQNLAVPPRRDSAAPEVMAGEKLFHAAGCAACHQPSFETGPSAAQPHLARQRIWPYTDLLLHDMGEGLADNRPEGRATGREWRTPPLWGIGLTEIVSGHTYLLHDGRARNVEEAILWHDGEAKAARDRFTRLGKADRARLIAFVNSL